jgi:hypothetical protein
MLNYEHNYTSTIKLYAGAAKNATMNRPSGKNLTSGPAIPIQLSNQLSYIVQLLSSNRKFVYMMVHVMPM